MRHSFKLAFAFGLLVLMTGFNQNITAQKVFDKTTAVINYNDEKMGTGAISYNTSFLIYHTNFTAAELQEKEASIKTKLTDLAEFKLMAVDNNTGVLVILNIPAKNKEELTSKIKVILADLKVEQVESNEVTNKISDFKF